jgi:hypothetical protein
MWKSSSITGCGPRGAAVPDAAAPDGEDTSAPVSKAALTTRAALARADARQVIPR